MLNLLRCGPILVCGLAAALFPFLGPSVARGADEFRDTITPFLRRHCVKCHGPDKHKGDLALHAIDGDLLKGKDADKWQAIAERLTLNEMPPDSQPRPDARAVQRVVAWIKSELAKAGKASDDAERKLLLPGHGNRIDHDALFAGVFNAPTASPARLWRLSPHIYSAFVPRVSRLGSTKGKGKKGNAVAQAFSTASGGGFKDYASLFVIDEPTVDQLLRNARQIAAEQTGQRRGGKIVKEFQPLLDPRREPSAVEIDKAIRRQFQLVLLREPSGEEMQRFTALMRKNIHDAGRLVGVQSTLATVLMLPEALYRLELGQGQPDEYGRRLLGPRELAYAIAFALTDDAPDAALLRAAEQGRLASRADVRHQVEHLLNDKRIAKPRIMRFFEEYFEFPAAQEVFKDVKKKGEWRPEVLVNDTRFLIRYILDNDRDVLKQLLTTNKSFINYKVDPKKGPMPARDKKKPGKKKGKKPQPRQLEIHDWYSLPADWQWTAEQPIELPKEQRAGILTQPSWLAAFATNNENHAIRRGKWVRERLLGGFVPDLPITVDAQLPNDADKTLRQRMAVTKQEYCWQCHRKMNDLGLTFEMFDYLGRYRAVELNRPVDAHGKIANSGAGQLDGPIDNAVALAHKLADSPRVRQVFVRHAFRFWMGRNETLTDSPTLLAADKAYVENGGSMKALITSLLTSDSFLYRYASDNNYKKEKQ